MGILIVSEASNILMRLNVSSLLRRNLFAHLLQQPGAKPLPQSPSEAISRFRDDIKTVENLVSSTANPIGQLIFIIVAVAVMIRINLLPEEYRRRARTPIKVTLATAGVIAVNALLLVWFPFSKLIHVVTMLPSRYVLGVKFWRRGVEV